MRHSDADRNVGGPFLSDRVRCTSALHSAIRPQAGLLDRGLVARIRGSTFTCVSRRCASPRSTTPRPREAPTSHARLLGLTF